MLMFIVADLQNWAYEEKSKNDNNSDGGTSQTFLKRLEMLHRKPFDELRSFEVNM